MTQASLRQLTPVPLKKVTVDAGFWASRLTTNRQVTLPIEYEQCKETGRIDAWKLDWQEGMPNKPQLFWDSDVAKWLEAVAYSLTSHPDRKLEELADNVIDMIEKAQQPDGYLNVFFIVLHPKERWNNLRDQHELYCAGNLIEAAVAYYEATGKRKLLEVLCRCADCIDQLFGPGKDRKRGYPGHEEIELALVKLYRATGEKRYLKLAEFFVNERGRQPHYFDIEAKARGEKAEQYWAGTHAYNQAHLPVREQAEVVGHAVRAMYLYSGMADVAAETGDQALLDACKRLWHNLTEKRLHITGGIGPTHANEGFTFDYDLPNEDAYLETCAAIGLVFWAHRMLQLEPDARYADVMERALYNGTISGVSLDGERFFYGNPLASYPGVDGNGRFAGKDYHYRRSEWFGCACCPPNILRLLASLPGYIYSQSRDEAWVHLYAGGRAELEVAGQKVELIQQTEYPWKEKVNITLNLEKPARFTLALRIPGWCRAATLEVNGKALKTEAHNGYAKIEREWQTGDKVELNLPMPVLRLEAHPKVRQNAGRVALQRGPLVYCLEEVDNGKDLHDLVLPAETELRAEHDPKLLGGVTVITGEAKRREHSGWPGQLYRPAGTKHKAVPFKAIPYFLWANRDPGEMIVWLRGE